MEYFCLKWNTKLSVIFTLNIVLELYPNSQRIIWNNLDRAEVSWYLFKMTITTGDVIDLSRPFCFSAYSISRVASTTSSTARGLKKWPYVNKEIFPLTQATIVFVWNSQSCCVGNTSYNFLWHFSSNLFTICNVN